MPALVRALPDVIAAERLAAALLAEQPGRLRHVRTAGAVVLLVSDVVQPEQLEVVLAATVLHDIGYLPIVHSTGFHPLDGAQWLLTQGCPIEVAALVAHHSEAVLQPAAAPFLDRYATLCRPVPALADVITYADQTTTPEGRRTGVVERICERLRRAGDAPGPAAGTRRTERLVHAVARVDARLVRAGSRDLSLASVDRWLDRTRPVPGDRDVAEVLGVLAPPPERDGLDGVARVTAAVHAARLLAATGADPQWGDPVRTAVRLLGDPAEVSLALPAEPLPTVAVAGLTV